VAQTSGEATKSHATLSVHQQFDYLLATKSTECLPNHNTAWKQ